MNEETLFRCPRHGTIRPRSDWPTHPSMGTVCCFSCRYVGWNGDVDVVPPEEAKKWWELQRARLAEEDRWRRAAAGARASGGIPRCQEA